MLSENSCVSYLRTIKLMRVCILKQLDSHFSVLSEFIITFIKLVCLPDFAHQPVQHVFRLIPASLFVLVFLLVCRVCHLEFLAAFVDYFECFY